MDPLIITEHLTLRRLLPSLPCPVEDALDRCDAQFQARRSGRSVAGSESSELRTHLLPLPHNGFCDAVLSPRSRETSVRAWHRLDPTLVVP